MRMIWAAVAVVLWAVAAPAEPVDGETARALVVDARAAEAVILPQPFLGEQDSKTLAVVAEQQKYYGAIAVAPSEGLLSTATVAAANYHDVATARAVALKGCDARRQGGRACVIVAEIRPRGWQARPLQLNADASAALHKQYRRGRGPKALAISPGTGQWHLEKGEGASAAALDGCAAKARTDDCRIVVAD
ncbi:hypothetical protein Ga0609869_003535 [Rhodovulum iodosum]|uniref:5-aminolevulic acid synthase n=1 Tax=Rhodovulum iodosum TaxID=68291 RepID=A0ABV3Y0P3_9RHOB|nr:5-aminolevulic acid synthase [Rhodovulum robiginosum]RSK38158.1 5-aminolevulic acid synthase [Rhodovulum robiginosum]